MKKREIAYRNLEYKYYIENNLKNIFKDYIVSDWTDLKNYNCYEYRILLHKNQSILDDDIELITALNNERLDLFIFISVLEKYYYIQFNKTEYKSRENKWIFKILKEYPEKLQKEMIELKRYFSLENYIELKDDIIREKVAYIETEVKNMGDVRIFDCLFTDIIEV